MKTVLKPCQLATLFGLLLMCSCATIHPPLPAAMPLNPDAARGNGLVVTLRLKSGEKLLFAVDTGSPCTVLDKSLEPELGHRFNTMPVYLMWGNRQTGGVYLAPRLYLGDTPLKMTDNGILTCDLKSVALPGTPRIMGILGLNVLEHYCLQLDFAAGQMRFLDPRHLPVADLGLAFPIFSYSEDPRSHSLIHPYIQQPGLLGGAATRVLIDTGLRVDGAVDSEYFQRETARQMRQEGTALPGRNGRVWFARSVWNGETYTNLLIGSGGGAFADGKIQNLIGLGFLARHLVTFDFPHRMMYLKQTSTGPLVDENMNAAKAFLNGWHAGGELPGLSAHEPGTVYLDLAGLETQFDVRKNGDPSAYHYQAGRPAPDSPWKLQKAWRTDPNGKTVEEYPVP